VVACGSVSRVDDSGWSRTYSAGFDSVWAAAEQVLEEQGFEMVDVDGPAGRIRAAARAVELELHLIAGNETVRIDVLAAGAMDGPPDPRRFDSVVTTVLQEVARVLMD
jgi:hypothetical protein